MAVDGGDPQGDLASNLLAAIVASSEDAIISKTAAGIITSWNRSAERIFGYTAQEAIGQPIRILAVPGNEDEMPALLARVTRGERVEHLETIRRRKDGSLVHISLSISPILDAAGQVVGASKIARDITAVKAAAAALADAERRLFDLDRELQHATRLRELGQMAATIAHELNQPLSAIANYIAGSRQLIVQSDVAEKDDIAQALWRAAEQVIRATEVIRRLRAYARPDDGTIQPEQLDLIVEETTALATLHSSAQDVSVTLEHDSGPIVVRADRIGIQQVLLNLIRNSFEAMSGQQHRELRIDSRSNGTMAEIRVSDTGPGIDPRFHDRLFLPFATTKTDGMGIGLSISRKIINAHGGKLWVEHPAQGGCAFVFTIPLASPVL